MKRIPNLYKPVRFRCVTPIDNDGYIGIGFNCDNGEVIRIQIPYDDLKKIIKMSNEIEKINQSKKAFNNDSIL